MGHQRFDIVTACRKKDLRTLELAVPRLRRFLPHGKLVVFTARENIPLFQKKLGPGIEYRDEDKVFPDMGLEDLKRKGNLPGFPRGAGWYFQQFLKLAYPMVCPETERYLIWDADTVPLRSFAAFDSTGRALLTPATMDSALPPPGVFLDTSTIKKMEQATRPHRPYFENYRHLFGEEPCQMDSFIAQQMPIHVPTLRKMIARIKERFSGPESWPWKVINNLQGHHGNLFSEYEFYAHFALQHAAERHAVRTLVWSRAGRLSRGVSPEGQLQLWSESLDYVALESWASPWRRLLVQIFSLLPESIRGKIRKSC